MYEVRVTTIYYVDVERREIAIASAAQEEITDWTSTKCTEIPEPIQFYHCPFRLRELSEAEAEEIRQGAKE